MSGTRPQRHERRAPKARLDQFLTWPERVAWESLTDHPRRRTGRQANEHRQRTGRWRAYLRRLVRRFNARVARGPGAHMMPAAASPEIAGAYTEASTALMLLAQSPQICGLWPDDVTQAGALHADAVEALEVIRDLAMVTLGRAWLPADHDECCGLGKVFGGAADSAADSEADSEAAHAG